MVIGFIKLQTVLTIYLASFAGSRVTRSWYYSFFPKKKKKPINIETIRKNNYNN